MLTVGSLFAGIGGFDLGFEMTGGFKTEWVVENNIYCLDVMKRRFPLAAQFGDVETLSHPPHVDVMCGGFPCQDISNAGTREGLNGERSGLWSQYARLVGEVRPSFVVVENVRALRSRGLGRVLSDLSDLGYDAEWDCIRASDVGAPHERARLWIVAYPTGFGCSEAEAGCGISGKGRRCAPRGRGGDVADPSGPGPQGEGDAGNEDGPRPTPGASEGPNVADPHKVGCKRDRLILQPERWSLAPRSRGGVVPHAGGLGHETSIEAIRAGRHSPFDGRWWESEPAVDRVAHGVPNRVDRVRAIGNSLVPRIPFWIGQGILSAVECYGLPSGG